MVIERKDAFEGAVGVHYIATGLTSGARLHRCRYIDWERFSGDGSQGSEKPPGFEINVHFP